MSSHAEGGEMTRREVSLHRESVTDLKFRKAILLCPSFQRLETPKIIYSLNTQVVKNIKYH